MKKLTVFLCLMLSIFSSIYSFDIPVYASDSYTISNDGKEKGENDIYKDSGCEVFFISSKEKIGLEMLKERLAGKTTVLAGPSGVGKSTTTNLLQNQILMATGEISQKIARGKHTTRHAELIMMGPDTYLVDTPGFSSLWSLDVKREELKDYYPEFMEYNQSCRFLGCVHYKEPNCAIKDMVASGKISQSRYDNYIQILEEISEKEKNKKRY